MAASIEERAQRDAGLQVADQLAALADQLRTAQSGAQLSRDQLNVWLNQQLTGLMSGWSRNVHGVESQLAASNMGYNSGQRVQGLEDIATARMSSEGDIRSQATQKFMEIASNLQTALDSVGAGQTAVAQKKGALIGQLIDQYTQEERDYQLQAEQNRIAWFNATTNRMGTESEINARNAENGNVAGMSFEQRRAAAMKLIGEAKVSGTNAAGQFVASDLYGQLLGYGSDVMQDNEIWKNLYSSDRSNPKGEWYTQKNLYNGITKDPASFSGPNYRRSFTSDVFKGVKNTGASERNTPSNPYFSGGGPSFTTRNR